MLLRVAYAQPPLSCRVDLGLVPMSKSPMSGNLRLDYTLEECEPQLLPTLLLALKDLEDFKIMEKQQQLVHMSLGL